MKHIICIILLACLVPQLTAQVYSGKKPPTLIFHAFYNDFRSAQLWHKISDMQMGFGFNYLQGINKKIDAVATLDGSSTDYLFKNGSTNGSSKFLLDANAALNIKLLTDNHTLVPYFSVGAGLSSYKGKTGFYIPIGGGLQLNLFNEAFVLANIQYRHALSPTVNDHLYYSIGLGTNIGKKKKIKIKTIVPPEEIRVPEPVIVQTEVKLPVKNILIRVTDDQTGLPLPAVEVTINGPSGKLNSFSDASGQVSFNAIEAADYTVSGVLHGITTSIQNLSKNSFDVSGQEIIISISHHDPRFTLAGRVNNKSTHNPEGNVTISVVNTTQNSTTNQQNQLNDGSFSIPLEAAGDFTISGKKAGYISNIEKVSTKGLNRSTTLYVKLELEIEEAKVGQSITLNNIYFEVGKANLNTSFSSDLDKLIQFLIDNTETRLEIQGHTDNTGSMTINTKLSQARATSIVTYLTKNGIDGSRLSAKGFGPSLPVASNTTEEGRAKNRRVVMKVVQ